LLSSNDPHTEILGGPGSSLGSRRAEKRTGVMRCPVTLFFVTSYRFSGEEHGRDHELAAVGMRPFWMQGGAIA